MISAGKQQQLEIRGNILHKKSFNLSATPAFYSRSNAPSKLIGSSMGLKGKGKGFQESWQGLGDLEGQ